MKSAHPRTPGGRQAAPDGAKSTPSWMPTKFMPVKQFKAPVAKTEKDEPEKK
ncbi:MAG: hypothetical protein WCD79_02165 [Chthoniobacteraceae bacterium]